MDIGIQAIVKVRVVPRDDGKNRPKEQGERKGEEAPGENGSAKRAG